MREISKAVCIAITITLLFAPNLLSSQSYGSTSYAVSFAEVGLPQGTDWTVSIGNIVEHSINKTIAFEEPNGKYLFTISSVPGFTPHPSSIYVLVSGENVSYVIVWSPVLYPVSFVESGLASGTFWNVTLGNVTSTSSNDAITFNLSNGTYTYTIPSVDGIPSSIANGTLRVNGSPVKVLLRFVVALQLTFIENGLPSGTHWSVWINGSYYDSSSSLIAINLPNSTYNYVVLLPTGYSTSEASGKVSWNNTVVLVEVSSPLWYEIAISALVVLIALIAIFYFRRLKGIKHSLQKNEDKEEKK